ncbi:hypothetical protein INT45_003568 [Circinella minor]|uniref:Uncharacterized protein n=1 Tax=Circinella minor TaxID=1195481 RepID=A0A8H7S364_9FUNG|nr:hypothetical protein INT45_003568 [Circinella minor]
MWILSTGTKVEKAMQKCASENKLEQYESTFSHNRSSGSNLGMLFYRRRNSLDTEDLYTLSLPVPPGTDPCGKVMLRTDDIKNIIISSVVGGGICAITPRFFAPVIVEIQKKVSREFIAQLMRYSLNVFDETKGTCLFKSTNNSRNVSEIGFKLYGMVIELEDYFQVVVGKNNHEPVTKVYNHVEYRRTIY